MADFNMLSTVVSVAVYTWDEFKEYCFPIICAACNTENRKKSKLSIFSGRSFDKTCYEFEKCLDKISKNKKKGKNKEKLGTDEKDKLKKILSKYKGKHSEKKLAAMTNFISYLDSSDGSGAKASIDDIKKRFQSMKDVYYAKSEDMVMLYEFKKELEDNLKSFGEGKIVDEDNLKIVEDVVKKYRNYFNENQSNLIQSITMGVAARIGTMQINFSGDMSKQPARTIVILLSDYEPHADNSTDLKKFCKKCRDELEKRFSDERKSELTSADPKNMKDVEFSIDKKKSDFKQSIRKMQEYAKAAEKLA